MPINEPLVTVLMPAYNVAPYIRQAMDSVLAQTFTDFEFVIVNDGSKDETEAIIKTYNDPRIRLHTQENKGVIGALNKGLELARGKYIARFDSDDICYPERLQIQVDFMKEHPDCVLLGSAADYVDKDNEFLFEWQPPAYDSARLKEVLQLDAAFEHPTVMYKKDVAIALGGYPQGAIHFEDHLFWTLFFKHGTAANIPQSTVRRRFNPESVTIDEKWRGPVFKEIKYRSIANGFVNETDRITLKELLVKQDFKTFKEAAYYSMIGKKYLWNQHDARKARQHLAKAISIMPGKPEPYVLYLLSFLPGSLISTLYSKLKK